MVSSVSSAARRRLSSASIAARVSLRRLIEDLGQVLDTLLRLCDLQQPHRRRVADVVVEA